MALHVAKAASIIKICNVFFITVQCFSLCLDICILSLKLPELFLNFCGRYNGRDLDFRCFWMFKILDKGLSTVQG